MSFAGVVIFRDGKKTWEDDLNTLDAAARWLSARKESTWTAIELGEDGRPTGVLLRYFDPTKDEGSEQIRERLAWVHFGHEPIPAIADEVGDRAARALNRLAIRLGGGSTVTVEEASKELARIRTMLEKG